MLMLTGFLLQMLFQFAWSDTLTFRFYQGVLPILSTISLRCLHSSLWTVASTLVELPQGLAGRDCLLFFERNPLLKARTRSFSSQHPKCYLHSSWIGLWHNLAAEKFYIRVFLLDNLPATANEHYQSRFNFFHLVGNWTRFLLAFIRKPPWHK